MGRSSGKDLASANIRVHSLTGNWWDATVTFKDGRRGEATGVSAGGTLRAAIRNARKVPVCACAHKCGCNG